MRFNRRNAGPQTHRCQAEGCDAIISCRLLMCPGHWALVPGDIAKLIYDTKGGRDSFGYMQAVRKARAAVAEAEAKERVNA